MLVLGEWVVNFQQVFKESLLRIRLGLIKTISRYLESDRDGRIRRNLQFFWGEGGEESRGSEDRIRGRIFFMIGSINNV